MEKAAKKLAEKIGSTLNYSNEQKAVMAYGFIGLFQFFVILTLIGFFGLIFGFFIESLIIFFAVGLLRRTIGGAHSDNFYSCIIISTFFITLMAGCCKYLFKYLGFIPLTLGISVVYLLAIILIYKLAPVASPNKPIKTEAKRKRLRKNAFITLGVFITASIFLLIFTVEGREYLKNFCIALALSVLWQILLLTKFGHAFMNFLDSIFLRSKRKYSGK